MVTFSGVTLEYSEVTPEIIKDQDLTFSRVTVEALFIWSVKI
jgi:hypothetical protein